MNYPHIETTERNKKIKTLFLQGLRRKELVNIFHMKYEAIKKVLQKVLPRKP